MEIAEHINKVLIPLHILNVDMSITTLTTVMWFACLVIFLFFYASSRSISVIPRGLQNFAELYIQVIDDYMFAPIGKDKQFWLPFVVTLFSFILICNFMGLLPGIMAPSGNINFTATLAIMVFLLVHILGIRKNGFFKYFAHLVPPGIPLPMQILLFPIEMVSQLARPFSLAVRLFANLFAGHMVIVVIVGLIIASKNFFFAPVPLLGIVILSAFEIFVAFIQAFIFTFLTALYIGEAVHAQE